MENLTIDKHLSKEELYKVLIPQINSLIEGESYQISRFANIAAALKGAFDHLWIGFYLVSDDEQELMLGPFQGPVACARIAYGKGVCGTSWKEERIVIVDDVDKFPGHIACSSFSRSEIVVPIFWNGKIIAVLDIDSEKTGVFDKIDAEYLSQIHFI